MTGLVCLVGLAMALEVSTVFEIGTFNGFTSLTLAMNLPSATIHTLDLPEGATPTLALAPGDSENLGGGRSRVYVGHPEQGRIVQHLDDSATFNFAPWRGACDVVYIDGSHSYDYVASDSRAAREMVAEAGAIVWDDYWRKTPDVVRWLDEMGDAALYRILDTRLVVWLSAGAHTKLLARADASHLQCGP